jgi:O-antigen/teichoic acid export membrane protein
MNIINFVRHLFLIAFILLFLTLIISIINYLIDPMQSYVNGDFIKQFLILLAIIFGIWCILTWWFKRLRGY